MKYFQIRIPKGKLIVVSAVMLILLCALVLKHSTQRVISSNIFTSCTEAHESGRTNIKAGDSDYNIALDRKPYGKEC